MLSRRNECRFDEHTLTQAEFGDSPLILKVLETGRIPSKVPDVPSSSIRGDIALSSYVKNPPPKLEVG
jgi:hypothetical protein